MELFDELPRFDGIGGIDWGGREGSTFRFSWNLRFPGQRLYRISSVDSKGIDQKERTTKFSNFHSYKIRLKTFTISFSKNIPSIPSIVGGTIKNNRR